MKTKFVRLFLSLTLLFSFLTISMPRVGSAQTAVRQVSTDLQKGIEAIEAKVDRRRKELGIPGMSLVIVKDGEIIYLKGLGYRDLEKKVPVTADTQFAIGSATKAFTALSVLMSVDDGKVKLDDSPKKYLSYFKMKDPETDKNITVRDLMDHSSGLNRTDLAMITERLDRRELIQTIGGAEPMAKLREKFFYNNVMYAAAGEITAATQKTPWEKFVPERIFKPLKMTNSTMTIGEYLKAPNYSFGYEYNFDTKETRRLPFRSITATAPAGSINSSARDMSKWITFVMNGGAADGKRLISENSFEEWTKPQMKITPNGKMNYGLGWFLQDWNGLKVVQHGGNIDGFNSMVAMIPEKKLGFVMLTNVSGSSLGNELMPIVWENILGNPNPTQNVSDIELQKEVGKYRFEAAKFDIDVQVTEGKLYAVVPGQPTYTLENVGGRKYKFKEVDGFFMTFKDDSVYLEQPQGNYTLPKIGAKAKSANTDTPGQELIGKYSPNGQLFVEIKAESDGRVTFNIEGQPPYSLEARARDEFSMSPLPASYFVKVKRDSNGNVSGLSVNQPEGEFEFKRYESKTEDSTKITPDELMAKVIAAIGGEENWRKINSRLITAEFDAVHQGVKGTVTSYAKAPDKSAAETTMTAVGKTIAKGWEFFDGRRSEQLYTFAPIQNLTGKQLDDARLNSDFYGLLNWKTNFKSVEVRGLEKVDGEDCYLVDLTPEKGTKFTGLFSTKSFLLLKRRGVSASSTSETSQPYTVNYSDYREVDGIKLPFRTVNVTAGMGNIISTITSVKHNVAIDDKIFAPRTLKF